MRNLPNVPLLAAALAAVTAAGLYSAHRSLAQESRKSGARPCVSLWGADSLVKERSYRLIGSEKDLDELWKTHKGKARSLLNEVGRPELDFERYLLVAVFNGEGINTSGFECQDVVDGADAVTLRFKARAFQTAGPAPDGGGVKTAAYGFFVIPRTPKPIVLEEDAQRLKDAPPTWKERARLSASGQGSSGR